MSIFQKLFKQTAIYGIATVLPRFLSVLLVPLYVSVLGTANFGTYAMVMSYLILGNVVLSYGMETAFFRFLNKKDADRSKVQSTALTSLTVTSLLFLAISILSRSFLADWLGFETSYIVYGLLILTLDALVILPFVWFRANEQPMRYAVIKIANVILNLCLNLFFFLLLPKLATETNSFWNTIYFEEDKVAYVFIANVLASGATFLILLPNYFRIKLGFDVALWKSMLRYAMPVLVSGIAFSINEAFDKILLGRMLPENIAEAQVGVYAACYKLGVFMTLFSTAFRLGIEPFFFSQVNTVNAKENYATVTKYFCLLGSAMLLFIVVFLDIFKRIIVSNPDYWEAMSIVPIILMANLCLGIYHNLSVWYKITDRTNFGATISVLGAIITLVLNFLLIPYYSYKGSAIATLAAYGSMMLVSYLLGRKYYAVPYQLKRIMGYMSIAVLFSVLSFYFFDLNYYFTIPLLVCYLMALFLGEKKEFLRMIRR